MWRQLTSADVAQVETLEVELFGGEAWHHTGVVAELTNPERYYAGAFSGERLVAYGGITLLPDADLMTLATVPELRGCGLGRALLTKLLDAAKKAAVQRVFLEVRVSNQVAQALY